MKEYKSGVGISWHRVPWTLGCSGRWTDENRAKNYENMCAIDGRIVLAGEHVSRLPAWQEGAVLSGAGRHRPPAQTGVISLRRGVAEDEKGKRLDASCPYSLPLIERSLPKNHSPRLRNAPG